jgi:hypothetical protein
MKTTTVQEMFDFLEQLVHDGKGALPIYFDTEAKTYNYHVAKIGTAYCEDEEEDVQMVIFHEERE